MNCRRPMSRSCFIQKLTNKLNITLAKSRADWMYRKHSTRPLPDPIYESASDSDPEPPNPTDPPSSPTPLRVPPAVSRAAQNLQCKASRQRKKQHIGHINSRIEKLEQQIESFNNKRELCQRCASLLSEHCSHYHHDAQGPQLAFEEFDLTRQASSRHIKELKGEIWMVIGILLLVIGANSYRCEGSTEIYKITHEEAGKISQQIQDRKDVDFTLYYQSVLNDTEGVQVTAVAGQDIMFEERLDISFRYDSLILMMDNVKEMLCFTSWLSV